MNDKKTSPWLGVMYVFGALLTLSLAVISIWADLESSFYGFDRRASTPLKGLNCPVLMNPRETSVVSLTIKNTTDKPLTPVVRADFSTSLTLDSTWEPVDLRPGEARNLEWRIGPENIDLKRFIFSKVLVYAFYPIPDREITCGTFIVNTPIPGNVFLMIWLALGLAGMGGGAYFLNQSGYLSMRVERVRKPATFVGLMISGTLVIGLMGWWVQGILLLVVTTLAIVITLNYIFIK